VTKSSLRVNRQQHWIKHFAAIGKLDPALPVWLNPLTPHHSLRLRVEGKKWLVEQCKQTFYKFEIPELNNGQLLQLDHLMASPYFIRNRKMIYLFGEQDAIMLSLHGNNLKAYLDSLALD
jgi:hypothetical protein